MTVKSTPSLRLRRFGTLVPQQDRLVRRRLEEFKTVAKWVMGVCTPEAGEVCVPADVLAGFAQSLHHVVQVSDGDARVPFASWPEVVFDAEVQLDATRAEPGAATCRQNGRLVDLDHAEDANEESSSGLLPIRRHRQLHVVEPIEGHGPDLASGHEEHRNEKSR